MGVSPWNAAPRPYSPSRASGSNEGCPERGRRAEDAENDRNWGTANGKRHGSSPQRRRGRRERKELGNGKAERGKKRQNRTSSWLAATRRGAGERQRQAARPSTQRTQRPQRKAETGERQRQTAQQFTAEAQPLDHARAALSEVEGQRTQRTTGIGERQTANGKRHGSSPQRRRGRRERRRQGKGNGKRHGSSPQRRRGRREIRRLGKGKRHGLQRRGRRERRRRGKGKGE